MVIARWLAPKPIADILTSVGLPGGPRELGRIWVSGGRNPGSHPLFVYSESHRPVGAA